MAITAEQKARYAATRKKYYDANRDMLLAQARARRKVPEVKARESKRNKVYLEKNREKLNAVSRLRYFLMHPPKPKAEPALVKPVRGTPVPLVEPVVTIPRLTVWQQVRKWTRAEWKVEFGGRTTFRPRRGEVT